MICSLLPKASHKYAALPLLGSIVDEFDDWLVERGYTRGSRAFAVRMLPHVDEDLRRRRAGELADLTHSLLQDSWRALLKVFPNGAGTVRVLERFLNKRNLIVAGTVSREPSAAEALSAEYADHLRNVRGCAPSTISHHVYTAKCFLAHLLRSSTRLETLTISDLEPYIKATGKRLSRASLQHDIGALRGFLRFLAGAGRTPFGLDSQIDTPRLYRLEQLPRSLPWSTVGAFLKSIDRASALGARDYAMFLLIATYGLRASEVVALSLDDIRWREGRIHIIQRKTSSPMELPLTNEVAAVLVKHLKRNPPRPPHRQIFLRMRAPIGVLKPTAVTEAFQAWSRRSGLEIPFQGPHCIRHSYAAHLLNRGTSLKMIGDILGHRSAESTTVYLRLATGDLREVALPVPSAATCKAGVPR